MPKIHVFSFLNQLNKTNDDKIGENGGEITNNILILVYFDYGKCLNDSTVHLNLFYQKEEGGRLVLLTKYRKGLTRTPWVRSNHLGLAREGTRE